MHDCVLAGPDSPTGVAVEANGCDSATVSWNRTQSMMCDATIVGYSLRYQLSGSSDYTTVNTSGTSVTLAGLAPNVDYAVSVADINSIGGLSAYSAVISFNITGMVSSTFTTPFIFAVAQLYCAQRIINLLFYTYLVQTLGLHQMCQLLWLDVILLR